MILDELQSIRGFKYRDLLRRLLRDRDCFVQKYGVNKTIGYIGPGVDLNEPGPSKWAWPTYNYFLSQVIATQSHLVSFFIPSYRPSFQFMTRYSRFIWAPDIKTLSVDEVKKTVNISTPEKLWWKRLVYKRKTDDGYDLIVHLVRIPPTEKVDISWTDEPLPLKEVEITADIGAARLRTAQACRPCYLGEAQQVVQKALKAKVEDGKVTVRVPSFRYYTMVVFRVETK